MLTRNEIVEKLRDIVVSADGGATAKADRLTEESRIMQDLGFTSIGMLYIAIAVEETFAIRFDGVGISDFVTVGNLVDYIAERAQ